MKARGVEKVLITGGCGFIGSWTTDLLVENNYEATILDNLEHQVHQGKVPEYLNENATFVNGDVRDRKLIARLVGEVDAVIHLAAAVGVGQSMYQIEQYIDYNTRGTATLLDVLVNEENDVKKLVVASSMSIYGEGKYYCEECGESRYPDLRSDEQLKKKIWDHLCPECGKPLKPQPTDEKKPLKPTSVYAMSKQHQEELCILIGRTYNIPTTALRYFNTYGSRQALTNPYTGVISRFITRIRKNNPPLIFEDGKQLRDFVHVKDVAKANLLALEKTQTDYKTFNVGTGKATTVLDIAKILIHLFQSDLKPRITLNYRAGDVRHCYADIAQIEKIGYRPSVELGEGLIETMNWACRQGQVEDKTEEALRELQEHGLVL